jgi:hypothetical protein
VTTSSARHQTPRAQISEVIHSLQIPQPKVREDIVTGLLPLHEYTSDMTGATRAGRDQQYAHILVIVIWSVSHSRLLLGLLALRDNSAYIVDRLRHPSFDRRFVTAQLDRTARDGALERCE